MSYIDFDHITKEYNSGGSSIFALKDASFSVKKGNLPSSLALPVPVRQRR